VSSSVAFDPPQPEPAPEPQAGTLADLLLPGRATGFAGRTELLHAFREMLRAADSGGPAGRVLHVHGLAGIGKTSLLRRCAALAAEAGRPVVTADAAGATWQARLRERAARGEPGVVLLLDDIEAHPQAMPHLLEQLALHLPADGVAVLAGRLAPDPLWSGAPEWHGVLRTRQLHPLTVRESEEVLAALGVTAGLRQRVVRFSQGHPLALTWGAAAAHAGAFDHGEAPQGLVLHLLDRLLGPVPTPPHRAALEVCAHSRWTTEDLLAAALPEGAPVAGIFDWLRRLPGITSEQHGLSPDPLLRDLLDADLRWRNPSEYRALHDRVREHVLAQIRHSPPGGIVPATLALTYLHRSNGFVSRFVTWETDGDLVEVPYRPELRDDVLRFIADADGEGAARTAAVWLRTQPWAFRLYWDVGRQRPAGALARLRLDDAMHADPVPDSLAQAAWRHAQTTRPLRPHEHAVLVRMYGPPSLHSEASPLLDLMIHRVLGSFILQESTAWTYIGLATGSFLDPLMRYLDQRPLPEPVVADGTDFTLYAHDWRAVTLDRWMEVGHLVELAGPDARPAAGPRAGSPPLTVLSREQFDAAVSDALAAWQRKDLLARNPLTRSRMVAERGGDDPVEALQEVLAEALDTLGRDPRREKFYRAVVTGLLRGAPTREAAAERLGLPLSTFRRHLARGVEQIREYLWTGELRGTTASTTAKASSSS
jgi:hypothetical protein